MKLIVDLSASDENIQNFVYGLFSKYNFKRRKSDIQDTDNVLLAIDCKEKTYTRIRNNLSLYNGDSLYHLPEEFTSFYHDFMKYITPQTGQWVIAKTKYGEYLVKFRTDDIMFGFDVTDGEYNWDDACLEFERHHAVYNTDIPIAIEKLLIQEAKKREYDTKLIALSHIRPPIMTCYYRGFVYDPDQDRLCYNDTIIYQDGVWLDIPNPEKKFFNWKVTIDDEESTYRTYRIGCDHHVYSRKQLRQILSGLRHLSDDLTIKELRDEIEKLIAIGKFIYPRRY